MKSCKRCQREKVQTITLDDQMEVAGHTFTAKLPADRCGACGEIVIQGADMERFELTIALELAKARKNDPAAFRFMRRALKISPEAFAALLEVTPDVVGYWEKGEWPLDPRAVSVLSALVCSKVSGETRTLDCLRVLAKPRELAKKVRVQIDHAWEATARLLQMGSAPRTAPAVC
jgi:DNA-binding transcriptional regulator YiaG